MKTVDKIRDFYRLARAAYKKDWRRDLPLDEMLFSRFERARELGFGLGTSIYHNSYVYGDVQVGQNTWIGPFTILDGSGGLKIGSNCSISAGVQIYSHDTVEWAVSNGVKPAVYAPVTIGDCCYIGPNAIIAKGVDIGNRCIVGANTVVLHSMENDSKALGIH